MNEKSVTFLIDSGASECFVSTEFVEANEFGTRKTTEKLKIHLADGIVWVATTIIEQACV